MPLMSRLITAAIACAVAVAPAAAQSRNGDAPRWGSVYDGYGNAVFASAGHAFAAHTSDGDFDVSGFSGGGGYRRAFLRRAGFRFFFQPEIVYVRESEGVDILGVEIDNTLWGLAGLLSTRVEYPNAFLTPFVSAGVGPAYFETVVDDGISKIKDGELAVGYGARAGVERAITRQISLEAAYRYLGATREQAIGFHGAEIGVNYNF
ncbi:MAG: outer membrane protein [Parvularculaceae bacterium]